MCTAYRAGQEADRQSGRVTKIISRLTDKVMKRSNTIERLQEKVSDLGCLECHLGREQVQAIRNVGRGGCCALYFCGKCREGVV